MSLFEKFNVSSVAIFDFETTGLSPQKDFPTEIAIRKIGFDKLTATPYDESYSSLIQLPLGESVPEFITELTGLTTEKLLLEGIPMAQLIPEVQNLIDSETLVVAHNANFDLGFLFHHMGIEPAHFMCTRTISILSEPNKNASLKNVFARMFGEKEQTHRAGDDTDMTMDIFNEFIGSHGNDSLMFFKNKIVNMPDREICFKPHNAIVLDFTEKYVSKEAFQQLAQEKDSLQEDSNELNRLRANGVDNWSGYSEGSEYE